MVYFCKSFSLAEKFSGSVLKENGSILSYANLPSLSCNVTHSILYWYCFASYFWIHVAHRPNDNFQTHRQDKKTLQQ